MLLRCCANSKDDALSENYDMLTEQLENTVFLCWKNCRYTVNVHILDIYDHIQALELTSTAQGQCLG